MKLSERIRTLSLGSMELLDAIEAWSDLETDWGMLDRLLDENPTQTPQERFWRGVAGEPNPEKAIWPSRLHTGDCEILWGVMHPPICKIGTYMPPMKIQQDRHRGKCGVVLLADENPSLAIAVGSL